MTQVKRHSKDAVIGLLRNAEFDSFLGSIETDEIDFKRDAYWTIGTTRPVREQKQLELAKDVTAMANTKGGLIVVGVDGHKEDNSHVTSARKICGIDKALFDEKSFFDSLKSNTEPNFNFDHCKIEWIKFEAEKYIQLLIIEDINEIGIFPYIVKYSPEQKQLGNELIKTTSISFGIHMRNGDSTINLLSSSVIHQFIVLGLNLSNKDKSTDERLGSIESTLSSMQSTLERITSAEKTIEQNVDRTELAISRGDSEIKQSVSKLAENFDYFYLQVIPIKDGFINPFRNSVGDNIIELIKNPPTIRTKEVYGWDLNVWHTEHPVVSHNGWEIMNGDRKILRINRTGITTGAVVIRDFLDWSNIQTANAVTIRALPLAEYIGNFCKFIPSVSNKLTEYTEYLVRAGIIRGSADTQEIKFTASQNIQKNSPTLVDTEFIFTFSSKEIANYTHVAGQILFEIYRSGFKIKAIHEMPYLLDVDGTIPILDEETIKKIR